MNEAEAVVSDEWSVGLRKRGLTNSLKGHGFSRAVNCCFQQRL
jgi:hypothetical protein